MYKILSNQGFKGAVLFSSTAYLARKTVSTTARPPLVDMNFVENEHKKLVADLKMNPNATLLVGEEHESLKSFTAHMSLCKAIKDNDIAVERVYLELDDVSVQGLSPTRCPVTFVLMQTMVDLFGPIVGGGLSRLYALSIKETDSMEKDLFDRCVSSSGNGLTIAFVGINHIYGLKKLSEKHGDKKVIAIDHSFVSPEHYKGYQQTLLLLAQLSCDYSVDQVTKKPTLKPKL